jgi:hypothetical protein
MATEAQLAMAESVLNVAMMRLQGEHPTEVYTEDGYHVWLRSVTAQMAVAIEGGEVTDDES